MITLNTPRHSFIYDVEQIAKLQEQINELKGVS
jgi:hypothetical protein